MFIQQALELHFHFYVKVFPFALVALILISSFSLHALERTDYVSDVKQESREVGRPLELIIVPESIARRKSLREQIFNQELSREFERRYEDSFGRTGAEIQYRDEGRFSSVEGPNGEIISVRQQSEKERDFGNYMFRRMAEYHFDNYSKENENLKDVQTFKEQVTHQEVSVAPGYSVKSHYSISGNHLDLSFINPYVGSRVRMEMNQRQIGPSRIYETRVSLDKQVTRRWYTEMHYALSDGILALIGRRSLTATSSLSLVGSTYTNTSGSSLREHLGLIGYSVSF